MDAKDIKEPLLWFILVTGCLDLILGGL
jgi:hypothetical protein